jgi:hypothetical protein
MKHQQRSAMECALFLGVLLNRHWLASFACCPFVENPGKQPPADVLNSAGERQSQRARDHLV